MATQIPTAAEIEMWLRIRVLFFTNFWLRIRVRKKNAESCRSRLRYRFHLWFTHCCTYLQRFQSTATNERSFSTLQRLLAYLRSTMGKNQARY